MPVSPIRTGSHRCELPCFDHVGCYDTGDVIRCDDCGRYWKGRRLGYLEGEWYRISRLAGWWIGRRNAGVKTDEETAR